MKGNYHIQIEKNSGTPCACIDHHDMWDLVEFLSARRTPVNFTYHPDYFIVRFLRLDEQAATAILADWMDADSAEYTSATPLFAAN